MDSEGGECMRSMTDRFDYLKIALADRYKIERHLGEGGMANVCTLPRTSSRNAITLPGQQDPLFSMASYLTGFAHPQYDVSPDDQRFVMLRPGEEGDSDSELILVENWAEELKERVGN